VVVVSPGTGHGRVDALLERGGVRRNVRLTVPHFVAVGHILQHTDVVATVPERPAQALVGPFGLSTAPHPADLPEIAIKVFWHAKVHRDPISQWLRGLVLETFADRRGARRPSGCRPRQYDIPKMEDVLGRFWTS
jgi:DNA-binding transcriptional LysR family regulator